MGFDENQMGEKKILKQKLKSDCPFAQLLKSFVERLFSVSLRRSKSKCRRLTFVCMCAYLCVSFTEMMLMLLICATNDLMMIFKLSYKWSIIWSKIVISTSFFFIIIDVLSVSSSSKFSLKIPKGTNKCLFLCFCYWFFFCFFY